MSTLPRRIMDASAKFFTGQNKKLIHIPIKIVGVIHSITGKQMVWVEAYGECRSCGVKVWFGRAKAGKQWVPLTSLVDTPDDDGRFELHRCSGEMDRNPELRRLVNGEEIPEIE